MSRAQIMLLLVDGLGQGAWAFACFLAADRWRTQASSTQEEADPMEAQEGYGALLGI